MFGKVGGGARFMDMLTKSKCFFCAFPRNFGISVCLIIFLFSSSVPISQCGFRAWWLTLPWDLIRWPLLLGSPSPPRYSSGSAPEHRTTWSVCPPQIYCPWHLRRSYLCKSRSTGDKQKISAIVVFIYLFRTKSRIKSLMFTYFYFFKFSTICIIFNPPVEKLCSGPRPL